MGGRYFATAFVYNLAKVVSQGEFNMPRNHILWSSTHVKPILMKIIINSEKSGPGGLVATALPGSGRNFASNTLVIPHPSPYWVGWGLTLIGA